MGKQVAAGFLGGLAQLGEHLPCKQGVESSNLLVSIRQKHLTSMYLENFTQRMIIRRKNIFRRYQPNKPIEINNRVRSKDLKLS